MRTQLNDYAADPRPALRWWWFAEDITREQINAQLDWIAAQGFGRVEIAWVYPPHKTSAPPPFLSHDWSALVAHAATGCAARGLGCDFTLGTLWPFGGSFLDKADVSKRWDGPSSQSLRRSWEQAHTGPTPILDHLKTDAVVRYVEQITSALDPALSAARSPALFTDSWEVDPEGLWAHDFARLFRETYGYDITPLMSRIESAVPPQGDTHDTSSATSDPEPGDAHPHERYDYRELISRLMLERFFTPLTNQCHATGALARVQSHGAPTDLIDAYMLADIPESETMLFDPPFASIAASAAAQAGRPLVGCESFTCLYGWVPYPEQAPHLGEERVEDLELVADAGFANGVNLVVWHGKPFTGVDPHRRFYASTHVGPDAAFAAELPAFNNYLARTSAALREGTTLSRVAVYLPTEEMQMRGRLPDHLRRPSANWHWEMHYARFPQELWPYRPIWTNATMLARATVTSRAGRPSAPAGSTPAASTMAASTTAAGAPATGAPATGAPAAGAPAPNRAPAADGRGSIRLGATAVDAVYVDTPWLPHAALEALVRLARDGAPVYLGQQPTQPGTRRHGDYGDLLHELLELSAGPHSRSTFASLGVEPLVTLREDGEEADSGAPGHRDSIGRGHISGGPAVVQPEYWARRVDSPDGPVHRYFFAHPATRRLRYPLHYGEGMDLPDMDVPLTLAQPRVSEQTPGVGVGAGASGRALDAAPAHARAGAPGRARAWAPAGAITSTLRFRQGGSVLLDVGPEGVREIFEQPSFRR